MSRHFQKVILIVLTLVFGSASTWHKKHRADYIKSVHDFKPSVVLPVRERLDKIWISKKKLKKRIKLSKAKLSIEPLTMTVKPKLELFHRIATKIAKPGKVEKVMDLLQAKVATSKNYYRDKTKKIFVFHKKDFKYIDYDAYGKYFGKTHHNVEILPDDHSFTQMNVDKLLKQVQPYFQKWERKKLSKSLLSNKPTSLDSLLLPNFARKMVKKYTIYRGPNCFHSALAFNSINIPRSSHVNVKEEVGYHRAMINYDELWRVLNTHFYEVDAKKYPLKYGDILVFFDIPKDKDQTVYFKWIKHTAAYLMGPYTFSKGSKSPNTPYTVKTLKEEWKTWDRLTQNLGVKVFRKVRPAHLSSPSPDRYDWIY